MGCCNWHDAVAAADDLLLLGLGIEAVQKALDPTDPDDFVRMTVAMRRRFTAIAGPVERAHVVAAVNELDVDWVGMTDAQREGVVRATNQALRGIPEAILPAMMTEMRASVSRIISSTKEAMNDRFRLGIGTSLDLVDERVVEHAATSQATYATNVYGQRVVEFDAAARATVTDGLARGLRSPEIAENLAAAARRINLDRSKDYWQVVSSASTHRARSYGQLRGLDDAQIQAYRVAAVLDERTTNICRMMDGKVFDVSASINRVHRVSNGVEEVKQAQPWVRQRKREDGKVEMFVRREGQPDQVVGVVEESGIGRIDDRGRYSGVLSEGQLAELGVDVPPYHGLCRTTIVPAL